VDAQLLRMPRTVSPLPVLFTLRNIAERLARFWVSMLLLLPLLQVNVGKGGDWLFDHLMQRYQIQPSRTAMIGDRLDTDIAMGKQGGLMTLLPLTGELMNVSSSQLGPSVPCDSIRYGGLCQRGYMR
jgi:hypothetical protein